MLESAKRSGFARSGCSPTRFITNRTKGAALRYIDFDAGRDGYESIGNPASFSRFSLKVAVLVMTPHRLSCK